MKKLIMLSILAFAGCADVDQTPDQVSAALTAEQCDYFDVNGKVTICHATSSEFNPFVIIRTSVQGCVNGHEDHADDFVSLDGVTCIEGCYPAGAPVGAGDKCCERLKEIDGVCVEATNTCLTDAEAKADEVYAKYCPPGGSEKCDAGTGTKAANETFYAYWKEFCTVPCLDSCKDDSRCREACFAQTWGGPY